MTERISTTSIYVGEGEHAFSVWWDQTNGDSISLTTDDPRFTDEHGEKPGIYVTFSSNPRSANYNPGNFNRCARALRAAGLPAPAEVPVHPRELKKRGDVTAALTGQIDGPRAADATQFGWKVCSICAAVVTNEAKHVAAAHPSSTRSA